MDWRDLQLAKLRFLAVFLAVLISIGSAFAEPPSHFLSYEDYTALVRQKVAELPDLKPIWNKRKRGEVADEIYFSGGGFRGLVEWLSQTINKEGVEFAKSATPPPLNELRQKGADKDFWAPDSAKKQLLSGPLQDWDVLTFSFLDDSLESGGISIEKVGANPDRILDKLNGLQDYYKGLHVLTIDPKHKGIFNAGDFKGNSNLAIALRFLRISNDMPTAVPSQQSETLIKDSIGNDRSDFPKDNYWIGKALWKLYRSTGSDLFKTLSLLKKYNLLSTLGRSLFAIQDLDGKMGDFISTIPRLVAESGFSVSDLKDAEGILARYVEDNVKVMKALLPYAKTADDYMTIVKYTVPKTSEAYRQGMGKFIAETSDTAARLHLSFRQIIALKKTTDSIAGRTAAMQLEIPNANDFKTLMLIFDPDVDDTPTKHYQLAIEAVIEKNLDHISTIPMTVAEMRTFLKDRTWHIQTSDKVLQAFIKQVKTPRDFIDLTNFISSSYSKGYKDGVKKIVSKNLNTFVSLNPTLKEIHELDMRCLNVYDSVILVAAAMKKSTNINDIIESLKPSVGKPSEEYKSALDSVALANIGEVIKLSPSVDQMRTFLDKGITYVPTSDKVLRQFIPLVKTPSDYIALTRFISDSYSKEYKTAVKRTVSDTLKDFLALKPTVAEVKQLEARCNGTNDSAVLILGELSQVETFPEFLQLVTSPWKEPSATYRGLLEKLAVEYLQKSKMPLEEKDLEQLIKLFPGSKAILKVAESLSHIDETPLTSNSSERPTDKIKNFIAANPNVAASRLDPIILEKIGTLFPGGIKSDDQLDEAISSLGTARGGVKLIERYTKTLGKRAKMGHALSLLSSKPDAQWPEIRSEIVSYIDENSEWLKSSGQWNEVINLPNLDGNSKYELFTYALAEPRSLREISALKINDANAYVRSKATFVKSMSLAAGSCRQILTKIGLPRP